MLSIEKFSDPTIFESLRVEWTALERKMYPRSPFTGVTWQKTWWAHLRRDGRVSKDDLSIYTVRDANGHLIGIAPFMLTKRPGKGPFGLYELQALGADPNITELRCVICEPSQLQLVMDALKGHLVASGALPNWISWHTVMWSRHGQKHSPPAAMRSDRFIWSRPSPAYMVPLTNSWSTFEVGLKKKIRHNLKTRTNALKREGRTLEFRVVSETANLPRALDEFYGLVTLRSQVRHNNPFSSSEIRSFFNNYAIAAAESDEFCVFQLLIDGEVIASRLGYPLGKELFLHTSGNNPKWDRYGVMTMLLVEIFKWAIQNSFQEVNLSTGLDPAKAQWRPREIMFVDAVEIMPGLLNSTFYKVYSRISGGAAAIRIDTSTANTADISLPSYDAADDMTQALEGA